MTATPEARDFPRAVEAWLRENPGQHRPADVARALEQPTSRVANTLAYMARTGRITRTRNPDARNGPGASTYAVNP